MAAMPPQAVAAAPAGGKGKAKAPDPAPVKKGQFRETMWFKKGELDEAAAQAAAVAQQASPDAMPVSDKADEMPMEDRYKDDGTISAKDRERLSLRTGQTQMMQAMKEPGKKKPGGVSEEELVSELRSGVGKKVFFFILTLVVAVFGIMAGLRYLGKQDQQPQQPPASTAPATPSAPANK
jgi:hypothetical protein